MGTLAAHFTLETPSASRPAHEGYRVPSEIERVEILLAQHAAKAAKRAAPVFTDATHATQAAFLADASPLKLSFCTRRAGKSYGVGLHLFRDAYNNPGAKCLYLAKTRDSAKGILWHDVLKPINRALGLGARPNLTELSWTLPNEAQVRLLGADADQDEKDKLLGQKYQTVAVDEAEAFHSDLAALVYGTLKPAVADRRGTLILNGTPGNLKAGMFFELTQGQEASNPGNWSVDHQPYGGRWSCHRWSAFQNPHIAAQWAAEIAELTSVNPHIAETPLFQQNYLGRWAVDDSKLVYRYKAERNDFDGVLPTYPRGQWHFVLGIDLGFTDACSFSVVAFHDFDRCLYFVTSYKKAGLDITATSEEAERLKARYPVEQTVIDGANKQAVEELNRRHGLAAVAADKREKAEFIDIMNDEFIQHRIKLGPACEPLKEEYGGLIWDERALLKRKRVEHPGCENHCADGGLYAWRFSWQYLSRALPKPAPLVGTPEWHERQQQAQQQQIDELFERQFRENKQQQRDEREAEEWL